MNSQNIYNNSVKRVSPKRYNISFLLLGIIGVGLILWSTSRYNSGVTPDSVTYISVARNLSSGGGITNFDGSKVIAHPPLYPYVLAAINIIFKVDPLISARYLNAFLFGLCVYLSGKLAQRYLQTSIQAVMFFVIFVLVSPVLIEVSQYIWTEALFICFVLLFLIFSSIYVSQHNLVPLILFSVFASLASLTRYLGFTLLITSLAVIAFSRQLPPKKRISHFLIFFVFGILPLLPLFLSNYSLSGSIVVYSSTALLKPYLSLSQRFFSLYLLARTFFDEIISWFLPWQLTIRPILAAMSFLIGFIFASEYWLRKQSKAAYLKIDPILIFILTYLAVLIVINTAIIRYLVPLFVPIALVLFKFSNEVIFPFIKRIWPKHYRSFFIIISSVWLIYPIFSTMKVISRQLEAGAGYTGKAWQNSDTINYLTKNPDVFEACKVYSNGADAIHFLTGTLVERVPENSVHGVKIDVTQLDGSWPEKYPTCLVWLNGFERRSYFFTPGELLEDSFVYERIDRDDGVIYYISNEKSE